MRIREGVEALRGWRRFYGNDERYERLSVISANGEVLAILLRTDRWMGMNHIIAIFHCS